MALDPQAAALLEVLNEAGAPPIEETSVPFARQMAMGFVDMQGVQEPVYGVQDVLVPGPDGELPTRVYKPVEAEGLPLLVYFHGGGWVIGNVELVDRPCRALANTAGAVVASVEYRLAPETKFPGAVEDAFAALKWLAAHAGDFGANPELVVVAGDSAGGNLAAVTALMARDQGGPSVAMQVLIYPVTGAPNGSEFASYRENGEGYLLTRAGMEWFWAHYVRSGRDDRDWRAAPLWVERVDGLPPALVIVAGYDPLRDEGIAYARKLQEAGVPVTVRRYDGQMHGFFWMPGALDASRSAMRDVADALVKLQLSATTSPPTL